MRQRLVSALAGVESACCEITPVCLPGVENPCLDKASVFQTRPGFREVASERRLHFPAGCFQHSERSGRYPATQDTPISQQALKMPLYVSDGVDVCIFETEFALNDCLEEQDVERDVYRCFDAEGNGVQLQVTGTKRETRIIAVPGAPCIAEFAAALKRSLAAARVEVNENMSLHQLQLLAINHLDVY